MRHQSVHPNFYQHHQGPTNILTYFSVLIWCQVKQVLYYRKEFINNTCLTDKTSLHTQNSPMPSVWQLWNSNATSNILLLVCFEPVNFQLMFLLNICISNRVTRWKSSPPGHSDIQIVTFPEFERQTVYCQTAWSWNWLYITLWIIGII